MENGQLATASALAEIRDARRQDAARDAPRCGIG
jgi:hypothetical protein